MAAKRSSYFHWKWNYFTKNCAQYSSKCNICNKDFSSCTKHLINEHKLNKYITDVLKIWVIYQLRLIEKCETCKQFKGFDSFKLMIHLFEVHNVTVPCKLIPARLSKSLRYLFDKYNGDIPTTSKVLKGKSYSVLPPTARSNLYNWIWNYYTRNDEKSAKCICDKNFSIQTNNSSIKYHISSEHDDNNDDSGETWPYSMTENGEMKCDNCSKTYEIYFYPSFNMINHIVKKHNLNEYKANKFHEWVWIKHSLFIQKCEYCKQNKESNSFKLMIHLFEVHNVIVPPEFIPAGLSNSLNNLLNSCKDTATSSSFHQSTCSTDLTDSEDFDLDSFVNKEAEKFLECNGEESYSMLPSNELSNNSDNLLNSCKDAAISSSFHQSTCSTDLADSEDFDLDSFVNREADKFLECNREESYSMLPSNE